MDIKQIKNSPWYKGLQRISRKWSFRIGGAIVLVIIILAIFAPQIATYDPFEMNMIDRLEPPSSQYIMGTDDMGRDLFSRIVYGSRLTLQIGAISVVVSFIIGTSIGMFSGYVGGFFDLFFMRIIDILMSFPFFLLALAIVAVLGPSLENAMIAVGLAGVPIFTRTVRSSTLEIKESDFIEAAQAQGASTARIIFIHILPNVLSPVLILATLRFPAAIISAASLSFLGLGAQPPTPEWGALLVNARVYIRRASWMVNFPGLAILFTVMGFNLMGNALRDIFDPKTR